MNQSATSTKLTISRNMKYLLDSLSVKERETLAEQLGISLRALSNYRSSVITPSLVTCKRIAEYCGFEWDFHQPISESLEDMRVRYKAIQHMRTQPISVVKAIMDGVTPAEPSKYPAQFQTRDKTVSVGHKPDVGVNGNVKHESGHYWAVEWLWDMKPHEPSAKFHQVYVEAVDENSITVVDWDSGVSETWRRMTPTKN